MSSNAPGVIIRVEHATRHQYHHSVAYDGETHETACGMAYSVDRVSAVETDLSEWPNLVDSRHPCKPCTGSVESLVPELMDR